MTSLASRVAWVPAALAHVAVVAPQVLLATSRPADAGSAGPEWSRAVYDPQRDQDPFEWLGFTA
jgi:hypothetical protein